MVCMLVVACAQAARASSVLPAGFCSRAAASIRRWMSRAAAGCVRRPDFDSAASTDGYRHPRFRNPAFCRGLEADFTDAQARRCFSTRVLLRRRRASAAFHFPKWQGSTRAANVVIESSSQFVPAERGLNKDTRVLTVLLKRVTTLDSATGEVYVAGSPVSANLLLPRWRVILDAAGLALAAGLMVFLLTKRPKYAWIAVVLAAPFLLPIPIYGTTISLEKVVIILAAVMMLAQRRFRSAVLTGPGRWTLVALALFVAEMAVSSWNAPFHAAAIRETLKVAEYVVVFAVVYGTFRMDPDETALQTTLAWIICAVSILALAQPLVEPVQRTIFQGTSFRGWPDRWKGRINSARFLA